MANDKHNEADQPISLEERKEQGKPLVLVVDDDLTHRKLLELLAERLDITAHVVPSCAEAMKSLDMLSFDVILMDCKMPDVDGYDCTIRIRSLEKNDKRIPIIAVTANVLPENQSRCLQSGMDDFLPKPFTLEELYDKLNFWLQRKVE